METSKTKETKTMFIFTIFPSKIYTFSTHSSLFVNISCQEHRTIGNLKKFMYFVSVRQ